MHIRRAFHPVAFLLASLCACSAATEGGGSAADPNTVDASTPDGNAPDAGASAAPDPDVRLTALSLSRGALSPAFSSTTVAYAAAVPEVFSATPFTVTATAANPTATITVNGATVASGASSAPIALSPTTPTAIDIAVSAPGVPTAHTTIVVTLVPGQAYVKASNGRAGSEFGSSVAISGDTLVVGADHESSGASGIGGNQNDTSMGSAGSAYVFTRSASGVWTQQAYLKASTPHAGDYFGHSVAISGDTIAVSAIYERSKATGINGDEKDTSLSGAGAVYVFTRSGKSWTQQAYIKASNTQANALFGARVSLSGDTLAVGAFGESSAASGINQNQADTSAISAGAAYVFTRTGAIWTQQAYIKASNTRAGADFGYAVALSGDTLAVGAMSESSNATGVGGDQANTAANLAGAAYVFVRSGTTWSQQAYVKASNTKAGAMFGHSIALDQDTLAVGSELEPSNATGVGGNQSDTSAGGAGAVYVFARSGATWTQQAYVKASNTRALASFGASIALANDTLVVGATGEKSNATGVNGDQTDSSLSNAGAAYVFTRTGTTWTQQAYVKASNTRTNAYYGSSIGVSDTLVVGSFLENSNATGIDGNQADTSAPLAGAAYLLRWR